MKSSVIQLYIYKNDLKSTVIQYPTDFVRIQLFWNLMDYF